MNFVMSHANKTGIDACHFEWKAVLKCFCTCMQDSTESNYASLDYKSVFASRGKEEQEEIYPLTVTEIADALVGATRLLPLMCHWLKKPRFSQKTLN